MNSFPNARSEYSPLVRWLWDDAAQTSGAHAPMQRPLALLQLMGYSAAIVDSATGELPPSLEQSQLSIWLTRDAPSQAPRSFIWYHTEEFTSVEAAAWKWPADEPELISVIAVPLLGAQGAPDWSRAVALSADATSAWQAEESSDDFRFYLWTQIRETSAMPDLLNAAVLQNRTASTRYGEQGLYVDVTAQEARATPPGFPWSASLSQLFLEQHAYHITERLTALIANTGADAARVRQDYWAIVTSLCAGNVRQAVNGRKSSGTIGGAVEGETLSSVVARCGDVVSLWREASIPAVRCGSMESENDLTARLCASVAALQGQERCLAQTCSGLSWSHTPAARLPQVHHLMHCGINAFVLAAARVELSSARVDTPSETHQPFAAQWKPFADYLSRCSDVLAQGRNGARIGLLWPVRSAWAHYNPSGHRFVRWVEEDLQATAQILDDLHFDFVLLPEDDLCAASIEAESQTSTRLLCGKTKLPFEMIVLSSVTTLSRAAWDKLQDFIESGGKVAFFGLLPRWSERGRDTEFEERIGQATRLFAGDLYDAYAAREDDKRTVVSSADEYTTYPIAREYHSGGRLCCYQPRLEADTDSARLYVRRILSESLIPNLKHNRPIFSTRDACKTTASCISCGTKRTKRSASICVCARCTMACHICWRHGQARILASQSGRVLQPKKAAA
jgi:hypothetical protein